PFSRSATSVVVRWSVGFSFTFTIRSPGRSPALYAGEPGNGAPTIVLPPGPHLHPHPVVDAALVLAQRLVIARIEGVRMPVEFPQHARNGSFVDRLIRLDGDGEVLLHQVVYLREVADVAFYLVAVAAVGGGCR